MAANRGAKKSAGIGSKRPRPSDTYEDDNGDYDVGFAKPPKYTQFKAGASGNPKGRPKWNDGGAMLTEMIGKELYRPVRITQNGQTLTLPALQVALRRLVRMGAEGNAKAVESLLKIALENSATLAEYQNSEISKMTVDERVRRISELLTRAQRRIDAREGKQTKSRLN
jgi:Family of unknown function (DUF5681)